MYSHNEYNDPIARNAHKAAIEYTTSVHNSRDSNQILLNDKGQQVTGRDLRTGGEVCHLRLSDLIKDAAPITAHAKFCRYSHGVSPGPGFMRRHNRNWNYRPSVT